MWKNEPSPSSETANRLARSNTTTSLAVQRRRTSFCLSILQQSNSVHDIEGCTAAENMAVRMLSAVVLLLVAVGAASAANMPGMPIDTASFNAGKLRGQVAAVRAGF